MPRTARAAVGGVVYHVLNRGNGRMGVFRKDADYLAFEALLLAGLQRAAVDLFAYCLMPNHWHLVLRPQGDGDLARYLSWVTNTHVKRYRSHYRKTSGHLYQGRYKSFAVEADEHFLTLLRYVEANALRGRLVTRAQDWRWCSLGCGQTVAGKLLSEWPVKRPRRWTALVNEALPPEQAERVKLSLQRGRPLGSDGWTTLMAKRLGIEYTLNPRGRPRKSAEQ